MNRSKLFLPLAAVAAVQPLVAQRLHIILIMTDQQRGDALGCMGNDVIITPHNSFVGDENIERLSALVITNIIGGQ